MNPADYGWSALTLHRATARDIRVMMLHAKRQAAEG